jgi:hypothetical protein
MNKVNYVTSENGLIKMFTNRTNLVGFAKTAKMIAYVLQTRGLADKVFMGPMNEDMADMWLEGRLLALKKV